MLTSSSSRTLVMKSSQIEWSFVMTRGQDPGQLLPDPRTRVLQGWKPHSMLYAHEIRDRELAYTVMEPQESQE